MSLVLLDVSGHSSHSMSRTGEKARIAVDEVVERGGVPTMEEGA